MAGKNLGSLVFDIQADIAGLRKDMAAAERTIKGATDSMAKSAKTAAIAIGSIGGALALGNVAGRILETTREIEKLKATLETLEGGEAGAAKALNFIADFASTTPFQLEEITGAFIKLKALGLDPSEEALRSYGNTASAMGKSLDQFIEAVADATTGEFERLKEFGIKTSTEGDRVAFTFQGVTTKVQKSAEAIDAYLRDIGDTNFGGAMERQANTLDGIISNIEDSFTRLATADDGSLDDLKDSLRGVLDLLNDPQFVKNVNTATAAIVQGFALATEAIVGTVNAIRTAGQLLGELVTGSQAGLSTEELEERKKVTEAKIAKAEANGAQGPGLGQLYKRLEEQEKILALRKSFAPPEKEVGKVNGVDATGTATKLDELAVTAKDVDESLKAFNETLDIINGKVAGENASYRDVSRLTAEARIAQVGGDDAKALELISDGFEALQQLSKSGTETDSVLRGALGELKKIADKAIEPASKDTAEKKPVKGELTIEIRGNTYTTSGSGDEIKDFVVKAVEDALTFEAASVGA